MGTTTATVKQDILTQSDLKISQQEYNDINQSCEMIGTADNIVEIIGSSDVKLKASQKNSLQNMCILNNFLKSTKDAKAAIDVFNDLAAEAKAKGGFPAAKSEVNENVRTIMNTSLDQDTFLNVLQECTSDTQSSNVIRIIGSKGVDANVDQVNEAFNKCLLTNATDNAVTADATIKATTKAKAKADAEGMQFAGSASSGASCCIIIIIMIVLSLAYFMFSGKGGNKNAELAKMMMMNRYSGY